MSDLMGELMRYAIAGIPRKGGRATATAVCTFVRQCKADFETLAPQSRELAKKQRVTVESLHKIEDGELHRVTLIWQREPRLTRLAEQLRTQSRYGVMNTICLTIYWTTSCRGRLLRARPGSPKGGGETTPSSGTTRELCTNLSGLKHVSHLQTCFITREMGMMDGLEQKGDSDKYIPSQVSILAKYEYNERQNMKDGNGE